MLKGPRSLALRRPRACCCENPLCDAPATNAAAAAIPLPAAATTSTTGRRMAYAALTAMAHTAVAPACPWGNTAPIGMRKCEAAHRGTHYHPRGTTVSRSEGTPTHTAARSGVYWP